MIYTCNMYIYNMYVCIHLEIQYGYIDINLHACIYKFGFFLSLSVCLFIKYIISITVNCVYT